MKFYNRDGVKENTVTYHIKKIYKIRKLEVEATAQKIRVVRQEGNRTVNRFIDFYNLDMILSIGYRVNTVSGIQQSCVIQIHLIFSPVFVQR